MRLFKELRGADARADALGGAADGAGRGGPRGQLDARSRDGAPERSSRAPASWRGPTAAPSSSTTRGPEFACGRPTRPRRSVAAAAAGGARSARGEGVIGPGGRCAASPSRCPTSPAKARTRARFASDPPPAGLPRAAGRARCSGRTRSSAPSPSTARRRASSRRRSSSCSGPSPPSRRWRSRTPGSSGRSRTRAGSSRRRAATSPSSSPTCPTSCGRPLNAILGFSEVLAERMFGEVNEKQAEYLQDILSSGRHLLSLINDILDLSKVEAGRLELELGRFHLPTALDNALTLVRERATRHGITLTQTVDERLGDIVADERKVKQILLNLLSNAVKFTPEGGRVGVTATAADGVITIAVSDTGIGIAPEDQAAIFEEFRQVGREDARKQEGTGLGLTLAKKFVELHGGGSGSRARWARGRRSASRCPFGLTTGVRAIRAEARLHGHDVSPVPRREPRRRAVLRECGARLARPAQPVAPANAPGKKFCGSVRRAARDAAAPAAAARFDRPSQLHPQAPRREDPHLQGRPRGRAQAGHGALRRPQGLDGAAGRPRPRGGAQAPRSRARADDGGRPPLRGHGQPGHGRRDHGALRRAARPRGPRGAGVLRRAPDAGVGQAVRRGRPTGRGRARPDPRGAELGRGGGPLDRQRSPHGLHRRRARRPTWPRGWSRWPRPGRSC